MWSGPHGPTLLLAEGNPPKYDIETEKDDWPLSKDQWQAFITYSGLSPLLDQEPQGNAATTNGMKIQKAAWIRSGLTCAFTTSTLLVVKGLGLTPDEDSDAQQVINRLSLHIKGGINIRIHRHLLAHRARLPEENPEDFLVALREIASKCGNLPKTSTAAQEKDHLMDQFIAGIHDQDIAEQLLSLPATPTQREALDAAQMVWPSHKGASTLALTGPSTPAVHAQTFNALNSRFRKPKPHHHNGPKTPPCQKCGYPPHRGAQVCPADLRNPQTHAQSTSLENSEGVMEECGDSMWTATLAQGMTLLTIWTHTVTASTNKPTLQTHTPVEPLQTVPLNLHVKIRPDIGQANIWFLPDSGANIAAIPQLDFISFGGILQRLNDNKPPPKPPPMANGSRHGWSSSGSFMACLAFTPSRKEVETKVWVIDGLRAPILSRQACFGLDILRSEYLNGVTPPISWEALVQRFPNPLSGKCQVMLGGDITITVHSNACPRNTYSNRPIPINLEVAFLTELREQLAMEILEPAEDENCPGEWLNPMVVTRKKNSSKAQITVDLLVSKIPITAKYFTVLDGLKGFHQVGLDPASRQLTTFATPFGRFQYKRMPISDVFNARMDRALQGVPNIRRVVEDLIIYTDTLQEHPDTVAKGNISLNPKKVQYCQTEVNFGGYLIGHGRYRIDLALTKDLPNPYQQDRATLIPWTGSTTWKLNKSLNSQKNTWLWLPQHQAAFEVTRRALAGPRFLSGFHRDRRTELLVDASRLHGLGFLLRQWDTKTNQWFTIQCGSQTLAPHKSNWSGIAEIEALGAAWAAHKCRFFLDGICHFTLVKDSNPLIPILNNKCLDQVTNDRLLKVKTALSRFNFTARHQKVLALVPSTTSSALITAFRSVFLATAVAKNVRPDNAPQFVSGPFSSFLAKWGVTLESSSPLLSRTNGRAKAAVKALKKLVIGAKHDPDAIAAGILAFRNTPRYGGRSPAELLFGRNIRDTLPTHPTASDPRWRKPFRKLDEMAESQQGKLANYYNSRTRPLKALSVGTPVIIQDHQTRRWTGRGVVLEILPKHDYARTWKNSQKKLSVPPHRAVHSRNRPNPTISFCATRKSCNRRSKKSQHPNVTPAPKQPSPQTTQMAKALVKMHPQTQKQDHIGHANQTHYTLNQNGQ
eukprot:TCALIF_01996-PA protein Name:"Similar to TY3B-I Transposon Ty3-I Gag-Pol polyprotein (Saccharomyces cerevisiae (strain ATCC 204508 / S288c))" AED:0.06 eAED:0.13 QI:0/0/0/0.88/0.12/0.11/9/0/1153